MPQIQSIESFSFEIGGYQSKTYKIRALYNVVHFDSFEFVQVDSNTSKKYTEEEMKKLIEQFNKLHVLDWKNEYHSDILDGTQWELKINYNHSKVKKILGSNAYPSAKGQVNEPTEVFHEFLFALSNFIGFVDFFEIELN